MSQMQDTGERITYEDGAQREPHQGKGRYDWISPFALERVVAVGKILSGIKQLPRKEEPGFDRITIAVALTYLNDWRKGRRALDLLASAAWHVFDAIHFEETGTGMLTGGFESLSPYALKRLADWCEIGGIKYGDRNWEKGMPYDHPLDSCLRHINKWLMRMTDEDHLAAAVWNLFALMHYEACHMDRFDNIPRYLEARRLPEEQSWPETVVMNPEKSR